MAPGYISQILFITFCFATTCVSGQTTADTIRLLSESNLPAKARNSLEKIIQSSTPINQAYALAALGDIEDAEGYSDKALSCYKRSLKIQHSGLSAAISYRGIASVLITNGKYDSVLLLIDKSRQADPAPGQAMYNDLATARFWQTRNEHDKALTWLQSAYANAEKLNDPKGKGLALVGMGAIYFNQDPDMSRTLDHFIRGIQLFDSSRHANIIARNYGRMANALMVIGRGKEAEEYLIRADEITKLTQNLPVRGYILSSLAIFKAGSGDIAAAVKYAQEPLTIKRTLGLHRSLQNDLLNLSEWHMSLRNYDDAASALREGLQTSRKLNDIVYEEYFYERLATLDSLTGNYARAYSNLKKALVLKDSVTERQRILAVEELREKFETGQKEKALAEKELEIQQKNLQLALIISGGIVACFVLVVVLLAVRNKHQQRLQREKEREQQIRLQTIVNTQEEVQQSIARDLHDGLVQVLGAAKVSLEAIQGQKDPGIIMQNIRSASKIMDEACIEARSISHQLLPYSLLRDGLIAALEELFRKSLVMVEFIHVGEKVRVNGEVAVNIYRIAQEIVNNIIKHADATKVTVRVETTGNVFILDVTDNGNGFDTQGLHDGIGLTNLKTRTSLIHGKLLITSAIGEGTRSRLEVAIQDNPVAI